MPPALNQPLILPLIPWHSYFTEDSTRLRWLPASVAPISLDNSSNVRLTPNINLLKICQPTESFHHHHPATHVFFRSAFCRKYIECRSASELTTSTAPQFVKLEEKGKNKIGQELSLSRNTKWNKNRSPRRSVTHFGWGWGCRSGIIEEKVVYSLNV